MGQSETNFIFFGVFGDVRLAHRAKVRLNPPQRYKNYVQHKYFTLMIVPDANAQVKRIQIRRGLVYGAVLALMGLCAAVLVLVVHYTYVVNQVFEADELRVQNVELQDRLDEVQGKIATVEDRFAKVKSLDERLRKLTDLKDSSRFLGHQEQSPAAGGGIFKDAFAAPLGGNDKDTVLLQQRLYDSRLSGLGHAAFEQLDSLSELVDYFNARKALLASTPSILPAHGYGTSNFGQRQDPFTGERKMHAGIDVGASVGTLVMAPASGTVIFAGRRGAYGNMIAIDHGRGIITHYGHLSRILVKVGDKVKRRMKIGEVGNTGRSTGAHLHYEVRLDGVPVNPMQYVLD
ncbi:MAG: peptidoglycan DD-metalloendopeptidase family protein [Deltaproteobacteria bacterium]|nr:peptidoglycan DD-metalloendopeptidase family protein [Deltaproteobacteria bacterium]